MAAEPRQVASAELWAQWENRVVNGVFPLRRLLGCSEHGAVFLTEFKAKNLPDAAIKLVRADGPRAKARLKHWKAAARLSHPHLVRLLDTGRCRLGQHAFVFVVMEYAEQTLDQILRRRALSCDEVRELLPPTLDALAFLHRNQLAHGQLRPSNLLAVNDQLKLASDNARPIGHAADGPVRISWYDPPELKDSGASAAGDVWGLGMTLVEALTRDTPTWPDQKSETAAVPASLPAPFAGLVRRCLNRNPAHRPTIAELEAPYKTALRASSISDAPASTLDASHKAPSPSGHKKRNLALLTVAAALVTSIVVWVRSQEPPETAPQPAIASAPAPVVAQVLPQAPQPDPEPTEPLAASPSEPPVVLEQIAPEQIATEEVPPSPVLLEVMPEVPPAISERIRNPIRVTLRVLVDPAGDVLGALVESAGPNRSLTRLAEQAAREWKFVETEEQSARVWLLRFEFTREGVTATATEQ